MYQLWSRLLGFRRLTKAYITTKDCTNCTADYGTMKNTTLLMVDNFLMVYGCDHVMVKEFDETKWWYKNQNCTRYYLKLIVESVVYYKIKGMTNAANVKRSLEKYEWIM